MSRVVIFLLCAFAILIFVYALREKLGKKAKPAFFILFLLLILGIGIFEYKNIVKGHKQDDLLIAFNQGKSLICKNIIVESSNFNYEFGTSSFISKDINKSLKFLVLDIKDCKLNNE
ncbi:MULTISPECIES: hypothetical protein [unclassified Campylobacter]|uniref:hypothetical protein n=1 Tax=unclassified Campylobacter TaxID=2593542 RepID=UPI001237CF97|nr:MULTISPECIES: hypothetical protein [unclassified Campylobacter]KAA6225364.1 hypothetical protein FMM54_06265 [Campylobacter sp. LR185c]KAA6227060.1 hypothetical protein FMM55_03660 [Campylobacter sp. LR196d]KAA6227631.1 hypothetical protein FMM57_04205 [Campylobacter sp. LR286c]KAA6229496.1 hypothetical protein FMM56_08080 [Campylobacter sp. LR264d]KAA6230740.1 hypothetical protein FMM58_04835 [Campylobacter sp. LR291e]